MAFDKIVFIGAGRVATQLGRTLVAKQKTILQVYSRTPEAAQQLASTIGAEALSDLSNLTLEADLYIISVVDDAIREIAQQLNLKNKVVVHTSGSVPMDVLSNTSENYGVFYPLQTFAKDKAIDFSNIPICVEGSDSKVESQLLELGGEISEDIRVINSQQRFFMHIAAVFVNNFTNFMYVMGEEMLDQAGVSFDVLIPLIEETAEKIKHVLPRDAQTGPAVRGDKKVMEKHLKVLKDYPDKQEVYQHISSYIATYFDHQK